MHSDKNILRKSFLGEEMRIMEQYLNTKNSRLETFENNNDDLVIVYNIAERLKLTSSISEIVYCTSLLSLYVSSYMENQVEILEMLRRFLRNN